MSSQQPLPSSQRSPRRGEPIATAGSGLTRTKPASVGEVRRPLVIGLAHRHAMRDHAGDRGIGAERDVEIDVAALRGRQVGRVGGAGHRAGQ